MRKMLAVSLSLLGLTACPDDSNDAVFGGYGGGVADGGTGGDGGEAAGGGGEAGNVPGADSTLFVVYQPEQGGRGGVARFMEPASLEGTVSPTSLLEYSSGAEAALENPTALALSSSNELYVGSSSSDDDVIVVYADGLTATDPDVPSRLLHIDDGGFDVVSLALSENDETLYVVSDPTGAQETLSSVLAFDSVSELTGDVTPSRRIDFYSFNPRQIQMVGDDLYVAGRQTDFSRDSIWVVEGARTADGVVEPSRIIASNSFDAYLSFHISDDRLFVVSAGQNLLLFDGVSTLEPAATPSGATTIAGATSLRAVIRDKTGLLFISDVGGDIFMLSEDDLVVGETTPTGAFTSGWTFVDTMLLWEAP